MCSSKDVHERKPPEKFWVDKGNQFRGDFARFCAEKDIVVYGTHSEMKSCFAELYIRTLKSIWLNFYTKTTQVGTLIIFKALSVSSTPVPTEQQRSPPKVLPSTTFHTWFLCQQLQTLFAKPATKLVTLFEYDYASQRSTKATKANTSKCLKL